ncbi:hypothetical protein NDU88_007899 [Pleurodeles waltl]|uniref:Uncharacterized protein n=1 Tax=Pleurodeles waltl TaxID=8319 RepID=A0AAV7VS37_PLEWA|nr:hypothetical protein NDU88_007899 [Pleurodeles waltl]
MKIAQPPTAPEGVNPRNPHVDGTPLELQRTMQHNPVKRGTGLRFVAQAHQSRLPGKSRHQPMPTSRVYTEAENGQLDEQPFVRQPGSSPTQFTFSCAEQPAKRPSANQGIQLQQEFS